MTRLLIALTITAALVIIGLGGFFWKDHGKTEYRRGYTACLGDGAVLATEAARQLKNEMQKFYTPATVDRMLLDAGWLRDKDNR